jgi:hypothetical protein
MRNEMRMIRLSTSHFRLWLALVGLGVPCAPSRVAAQLQSQQLSCQLYDATFRSFSPLGDDEGLVTCVAGATPRGWPKALTPGSPVRVVGGGGFGPLRVAVFEFPRKQSVGATMERVAKTAGLSRAEKGSIPGGGFIQGSVVPQGALAFCGASGAVIANVVDSTPTGRLVSVLWTSEREALSTCRTAEARESSPPLAIPILTAPAGVKLRPGGSGFSDGHIETTARVDTAYTAELLLAHYATQLTAAGWTVTPSSARGEGIALRQLTTKDSQGELWHGALIIITGGREREVTLRMVHDRKNDY